MNLNEQTYRIKQMMGLLSEQKVQTDKPNTIPNNLMSLQKEKKDRQMCETKVGKSILEKAKTWWKNWLNNPTTKQKFKAKNNLSDAQIAEIFKNYISMLDKLTNIKYWQYQNIDENGVMYIDTKDITTLNVICEAALDKAYQEKEIVGIVAHEIQHVLDSYYELIPDESLEKDFHLSLKGYNPSTHSGLMLDKNRVNVSYESLKKEGFNVPALDFYKKELEDIYENGDPEYVQLTNELRSFIYGVRNELGKTSGQDITLDDVKKLADGKNRGNIYWLMIYALNSGKSMTDILSNINSYAVNTTNQPKVA